VTTRGVIYVHAAPAALTPHVEWAVAGVMEADDADVPRGHASAFVWTAQPAEPGTLRAEIVWEGPAGTAGRVTAALRGWPKLRFEVTEDPSPGNEGERYAWTPRLGIFHATVGVHGDIQVGEDRLRAAFAEAIATDMDMSVLVESMLGQPWDEELEPFRHAAEGAPVRILHHVV